ncbi:MAG: trigger factor [Lentisphaerae bacterium]|nr:trigger factor [Lentisphaerota bacterium]
MKVEVAQAGACRRTVRVRVPAEDMRQEYAEVVDAYTRAARIPGFRKGRAPAEVVERRFARDIVADARERLIPRFYREAVAQEGLRAVAAVEITDVDLSRERGLSFTAVVDVAPDFRLPKYRRIPLRREAVEVTDKAVDDAVQRLRAAAARFVDVTDRPAARDDLVCLDYEAALDGRPLKTVEPEGAGIGEGRDVWALLGEPELLPGIADAIAGMRNGEAREVPIAFPADFRIAGLAGRRAACRFVLKGIRARQLPEIDAEFLKQWQAASPEELREKVRGRLEARAKADEEMRLKDEITRYLLEKTSLDVPQSLLERESNRAARDMIESIAMRGATREQIAGRLVDIREAAQKSSLERVKVSYVLVRIADEERIESSEGEVDERVAAVAAQRGATPERVRAEMQDNGGLDWLRRQIRIEKTLDFLLQEAKVKGP